MFNKKPTPGSFKVKINVIAEPFDYTIERTAEPSSDGKQINVIVTPETPNKAAWKLDIKDAVRKNQLGYYATAIQGQPRALTVPINQAEESYKLHPMTKDELQSFINQKIFKIHYGDILKDLLAAIKPFLFIGMGLSGLAAIGAIYGAYLVHQAVNAAPVVVP
jgi:hypothetical protein